MGSSILSIGITGLQAAQAGLVTTGHNISNASTPGYSRQSIVQGTNPALYTGSGYFGQGTNVETVKRTYSQFLNNQVLAADTTYQQLQTYSDQISQVDDLLGDTTAGLSSALQDFFTGVQAVAASPSSVPARQSMLSQADALSNRFQALYSRLDDMRSQSSSQISASVDQINNLASQIGQLNQQIIYAGNLGANTPPNDLLDARDNLISQLNQQVRVSTTQNQDGSVNVYIGNGQPVVIGSQVGKLTTGPSNEDVSKLAVGIVLPNGGSQELPDSAISGGQLAGLLTFRTQGIDLAENSLGRIAISMTQTLNAQNQLGQDLNGNLGGNIFKPLSGNVVYPNQPKNSGSATIDVPITSASDLTTSDYSLVYSATNTFQLVRRSDGQTWTATGTDPSDALNNLLGAVPSQGFSFNMTGTPNVGDSFLIQPTRLAASEFGTAITDTSLIAAAAPITTAAANTNTGTGSVDLGSVTSVANLAGTPPALTLPVTVTYSGGNLTGFPAGFPVTVTQQNGTSTTYAAGTPVPYTDGARIDFAGVGFTISGQPANGDSFSVQANTNGVSDNRNAVLLGQLQQAKTTNGGTASYETAYAQLVSQIGSQTRTAQVTATSQQTVLQQATDARDSLSGVNLDEEAANLIRYQQAYQASGKVLEIASKLFDTILSVASS
jgi:flagellar hook-associated protein 1 FlgK